MDNQRYGMLFDTSDNSHYFFDAGTGKVISCTEAEKHFIGKILENRISLFDAFKMNNEFKEFVEKENLLPAININFKKNK